MANSSHRQELLVVMAAGWSSLPADLLREVSRRLPTNTDVLHMRHVCTHWRASTSLSVWCPWILSRHVTSRDLGFVGVYSMWFPYGHRRVDVGGPATLLYCCGTSHGWLVLMDSNQSPTRCVLWEPLSSTEILIPCLPSVAQVFLSADPLTSPDWMSIATQRTGTAAKSMLFFWRPGDGAWSTLNTRVTHNALSLVFHGGKLYCMDKALRVVVFDLNLGVASPPKPVGVFNLHPLYMPFVSKDARMSQMVNCNGDLLVVELCYDPFLWSARALVFKLEWTTAGPKRGKRLVDLGGYSLFLGLGDAYALSVKDFPAIKTNYVYYSVYSYRRTTYMTTHMVVYNLESDTLEYFRDVQECHKEGSTWDNSCWFCPRRPFFEQGK